MSTIFFDLRSLLQLPVYSKLRMSGMVRTILEWALFLAPDDNVTFIAPGQEGLLHRMLKESSHEVLAAKLSGEGRQSATVSMFSKLYCSIEKRDPISKVRRLIAIDYASRRIQSDAEAYLEKNRPDGRTLYFLPSVKFLPRKMPDGCVPVINLFDLIPLLFDGAPAVIRRHYDRSIRLVNDQQGHFVVNSRHTRHALICMYDVPPSHVHVVMLGGSPVPDVAPLEKPAGPPYFVCISGDTQRRKNVEATMETFARFLDLSQTDHELHFVGPGQNEISRLAQVHAGRWQQRVKAAGHVPEGDLDKVIAGAFAGLYLSLYEGFGLPPLEYMRCGIPVIASDVTSIPEVVADAGILVDPFSPECAAKAMLSLVDDHALGEDLVRRGYERVRHLSWEQSGQQLSQTFEQILSEPADQPAAS